MYPNTMFIICTVFRVADRNSGMNKYVDVLNDYERNFALKHENIFMKIFEFLTRTSLCAHTGAPATIVLTAMVSIYDWVR